VEVEESEWLRAAEEEWGHQDDLREAIEAAAKALGHHGRVSSMESDARACEVETVLPARAGRALPGLSAVCVWASAEALASHVASAKAGLDGALGAAKEAVSAAEAEASGKKKAKPKGKGKPSGKEAGGEDLDAWTPHDVSERMGLAPWEELCKEESRRVLEVTLVRRGGEDAGESWLCVCEGSGEDAARPARAERVRCARFSTEAGEAPLRGLWLHPKTPPGEYELVVRDASGGALPRGSQKARATGFAECRMALRVREMIDSTEDDS